MNTALYKVLGIVAVVLTVAVVSALGIRQYGAAKAIAQELGTVKESVQDAVVERKQAVQADASTAAQKAVLAQETRNLGNSARKELNAQRIAKKAVQADCCVQQLNTVFVLNDAIRAGNRVIESSR